jgi:transcriptional antiterminator Rof (Rho-off)
MNPTETGTAAHQGLVCDLERVDPGLRARALDEACDYRGDVTLTLKDGTEIEGYVFDRRTGSGAGAGQVRLLVPSTGEKRAIPADAIVRVVFSGKDTAAGKTFEAWVKRYIEKRLAGERASIESEALD